ncbi:uncharacterized protein G2W53_037356 [Senna tora]|uniref:Uncharacterized protein n=1 Tax=Senna tora TaxID=362788 RepID=A0A834SVT7_9FABA|nr:uncharacterized protein G2W53_037340 [Senna tora]KAF7810613.1 uncharacterized protein G2W53_037356 [Senna tora]
MSQKQSNEASMSKLEYTKRLQPCGSSETELQGSPKLEKPIGPSREEVRFGKSEAAAMVVLSRVLKRALFLILFLKVSKRKELEKSSSSSDGSGNRR